MCPRILQDCYIGIHIPWWLAASIPTSPTLDISPNVIPPWPPHSTAVPQWPPQQTPVCDTPLPVPMCSHCLSPAYEWEHEVFDFLFSCQFAENDGFQIHTCPYKRHKLNVFYGCIIFHGVYVPHFPCAVYHRWAFGLIPCLCYCEYCCNEHMCACVFMIEQFVFLWVYIMGLLHQMVFLPLALQGIIILS